MITINLHIIICKEVDGRFICDIPNLPGVIVYGATKEEALKNVKSLAMKVLCDRIDNNEL